MLQNYIFSGNPAFFFQQTPRFVQLKLNDAQKTKVAALNKEYQDCCPNHHREKAQIKTEKSLT